MSKKQLSSLSSLNAKMKDLCQRGQKPYIRCLPRLNLDLPLSDKEIHRTEEAVVETLKKIENGTLRRIARLPRGKRQRLSHKSRKQKSNNDD